MNILNRKAITKEILFKYLHDKKISVSTNDNTKLFLIEKTLHYWNQQNNPKNDESLTSNSQQTTNNINNNNQETEDFPINELSRTFSKWFFENYNESKLKTEDFWSDAICEVNIKDNYNNKEQKTTNRVSAIALLIQLKLKFSYFNPNICHNGIQGRMNPHGLVIVLSCGTLHNINQQYVGIFECVFGLLRDPFTDNNWKIKNMKLQCILLEQQLCVPPQLNDCEMLQEFLMLPIPQEID